jgi:uncharacterized repeat protein (TIGR01451 family)
LLFIVPGVIIAPLKGPDNKGKQKGDIHMKSKFLVALVFIFSLLLLAPSTIFAQSTLLPPKDLAADVEGNDTVSLSWTLPMDTSVVGFNVYRKDDLLGKDFAKVNAKLLTGTGFKDKSVKKGSSYTYFVKSINIDGLESESSNICGAPKMKMNTSATVTHMGKIVRIATPGDVIKYEIQFANHGYGMAKNVTIVYAIPKGTTFIPGTARTTTHKATISYFDKKLGKWLDKIVKEEDVSRIRFTVQEEVKPASTNKGGIASLKVMVNY